MKSFYLQLAISFWAFTTSKAQLNITYIINTSLNRAPISAFIYGSNGNLTGSENFASYRSGGNRLTGYNWENNFSNAGNDWNHSSDNYLVSSLSVSQQKTPGVIALNMLNTGTDKYNLFTLPAAGFVSRDNKGTVMQNEAAPSGRWRQVVNKKGTPFTLTPDTSDNYVYVDEFLNYLIQTKGKANAGGIKAYLIDNEPDLWKETHPRLFNHALGAAELVTKSIGLAKTVKDMDNTAEVFGYESYGFSGYYDLSAAPDWNMEKGTAYWYIDYYLSKMKAASTADGRRLLDVLSLHWYPEAKGDHRINDAAATTTNDHIARMQAPRTLWDSSYVENSWIGQYFSGDLPLLPRVMKSINQNYAGTKLAFTEYNYGDFNHVSSGIAQADVLGIFGKYGVYAAHYWNMQSATDYTSAGFKIFRNYDNANSSFGNTRVYSSMSDKVNSSVYTSIHETSENLLTMVVINKNLTQSINGKFTITSGANYTNAEVWGFDATSSNITQRIAPAAISGNQFNYAIPPLSVFIFKLKSSPSTVNDNTSFLANFNLFPNPCREFIKLKGTITNDKEIVLRIYDVTGVKLLEEKGHCQDLLDKEISVSTLAKGVYYIELTDRTYSIKQMRFVKQ
jgi:mannan endo-1,4-beta-mannosidase